MTTPTNQSTATTTTPTNQSTATTTPPIMDDQPQPQSPPPSSPPPPSLPPDRPNPHPNPTKIPIRPQKIRKLSTPASTTCTTSTPASDPCTTALTTCTTTPASNTCTPISPPFSTPKTRRRSGFQKSAHIPPQSIKPLSSQPEIDSALRHLRSVDPLLSPLIDVYPPPVFDSYHSPFLALSKSILYQQLAYKAGNSIYSRLIALCGGEENVRHDVVLALTVDQLKEIGVSGRKASYLFDLARKYESGILSDERVVKMDDRSLFTMLSMVKGIGSWSVHMFMIFSLHRPDVLPVSDLGVRKGVQLLYGLEEFPKPSRMEELCEKWSPYRSVGAWYMWRFAEGKGGAGKLGGAVLDGKNVEPLQKIDAEKDEGEHHQLQFVEPVNSINDLGTCIWETGPIS